MYFLKYINNYKVKFFNDNTIRQLSDLIGELREDVKMYAFKSDSGCLTCKDTIQYLAEIAGLNQKIKLTVYDAVTDKLQFTEFKIQRVPAIIILSELSVSEGVRFYGIPSGYEVHSLISAIKRASGVLEPLPQEIEKRIIKITKKIDIQVFVTPTCPNCPDAVITGHILAFHNPNITCNAIEAGSFTELSKKYNVRGVPKIIINGIHGLEGPQALEKLFEAIEKL